jgi:ABC-2 type transport system ATP-binding protein
METVGPIEEFVGAMRELGCECASYSNGRVKLVMPEQVEIKDMYAVATQRKVQIRRMNHRRDSLEDIFLNAMEGRSQTEAAHGSL